jgi:YbgC/YbaW family acyl-CoA thioester hydrolase
MPYEFKLTRRVEFAETDATGIMHFSNYFKYMEAAEHAFIRSLGESVFARAADRSVVGFPRVHTECDFKAPARFEDEIEVHLLVKEKREKVLTYQFVLRNLSAPTPVEVARGLTTVVCVRLQEGQPFKSMPLPAALAEGIQAAPPEMFAK